MKKEKDMNDRTTRRPSKGSGSSEFFSSKRKKKIKELEVELVSEKTVMSTAEGLLRKKNDEIKMSECAICKGGCFES